MNISVILFILFLSVCIIWALVGLYVFDPKNDAIDGDNPDLNKVFKLYGPLGLLATVIP